VATRTGSMEISEKIWKIKKQMNPTEIYEHSGKHAPMIAYFILKLHWKFTKGRNTKEKPILTIWDVSFLYKTCWKSYTGLTHDSRKLPPNRRSSKLHPASPLVSNPIWPPSYLKHTRYLFDGPARYKNHLQLSNNSEELHCIKLNIYDW
jgi:hypothetical protein